jgi:hypothetical protein
MAERKYRLTARASSATSARSLLLRLGVPHTLRPPARAFGAPVDRVDRQPLRNMLRIAHHEPHERPGHTQAPRARAHRPDPPSFSASPPLVSSAGRRLGSPLIIPLALPSTRGRPPQADEPRHQRDQEHLAGQHLERGKAGRRLRSSAVARSAPLGLMARSRGRRSSSPSSPPTSLSCSRRCGFTCAWRRSTGTT